MPVVKTEAVGKDFTWNVQFALAVIYCMLEEWTLNSNADIKKMQLQTAELLTALFPVNSSGVDCLNPAP